MPRSPVLLLPPLLALSAACSDGPESDRPASPEGADAAAQPEAPPPEAGPVDGPSLVIVTLDTTRADRIGAYGHTQARTPVIDGFAERGARFERAYATVPLTTPSHTSMFTGLNPTRHGIHTNGDAVVAEELTTLAEILQGEGYHTAASVAAFVTTRIWNFDQGFDAYFDEVGSGKGGDRWSRERPAGEVVDDLVEWLEEPREGAFFLWAHVYDPHFPYEAPEEWREKVTDPYDAEIAYTDHELGRLKEAVDAAAGSAGSHWIFVADHGEALYGEHGEHTHGTFVFDPTMRIPFIVAPAEPLAEPKVLAEPTVSGVDVMPTALGLVGLDVPEGLDGVDLTPMISAGTGEREPVYMESVTVTTRFGFAPEVAAAQGPLKLIDTPSPALYDVDADPFESKDLLAERPEDVARLRAHIEQEQAEAVEAAGNAPSPEVIEQLAALGYMGNDFDQADDDGPRLDAKDNLDLINSIEKARALSQKRETLAEAIELYRSVIERQPKLAEARMGLASALSRSGQLAESEAVYREAIELQPSSALLRSNFANVLAAQGRFEEGIAELEQVLELVPKDDLARIGLLRMLTDADREDRALALAQKWMAADPKNAGYKAHAGILLARRGQLEQAEPLLVASLDDGVPRQFVHRHLGLLALAKRDAESAIRHFEKEVGSFPGSVPDREQLAGLYFRTARWADADTEYRFLFEELPSTPRGKQAGEPTRPVESRTSWAQAVFNLGEYPRARTILDPALAAAPDDPDVLLLHANLLAKEGDKEKGKEVFQRAQVLKREQMEARKAELEALQAKAKAKAKAAPKPD